MYILARLYPISSDTDFTLSPGVQDYYEPWTYEYDRLLSAPKDSPALPVARAKSQLTGEYMPTIEWGPNWDDDLGGSTRTM